MDEFLKPNACFYRLLGDWEKYGKICVAFDFDQTISPFHDPNATYDMVKQLLYELDEIGADLVCWSANPDHAYIQKYLDDCGIKCVGINVDVINLGWESRKPLYSALLDDRAGLESMYRDLKLLVWYVKRHNLQYKKEENESLLPA